MANNRYEFRPLFGMTNRPPCRNCVNGRRKQRRISAQIRFGFCFFCCSRAQFQLKGRTCCARKVPLWRIGLNVLVQFRSMHPLLLSRVPSLVGDIFRWKTGVLELQFIAILLISDLFGWHGCQFHFPFLVPTFASTTFRGNELQRQPTLAKTAGLTSSGPDSFQTTI